jgi:hypothetical protein
MLAMGAFVLVIDVLLLCAFCCAFALVVLSPGIVALFISKASVFRLLVTTRPRVRRVIALEGSIVATGVYRGSVGKPTVARVEREELVEAMCPAAVERAAKVCRAYGCGWIALAFPIVFGSLHEVREATLGPCCLLGLSGLALAVAALAVRSKLLRMNPSAPRGARILGAFISFHLVGLTVGILAAARSSPGYWEILSPGYFGVIPIVAILLSVIVAGDLGRAVGPFKDALAQAEPVKPGL